MVRQTIDGSGNVILFYIVKQGETTALALVGIDPKQTGEQQVKTSMLNPVKFLLISF